MARWIVDRTVLSVDWLGACWIPAFQLCPASWTVHPALAPAMDELPRPVDPWGHARWLAQPNAALEERRPADMLVGAPDEVRQAARMVRFALRG